MEYRWKRGAATWWCWRKILQFELPRRSSLKTSSKNLCHCVQCNHPLEALADLILVSALLFIRGLERSGQASCKGWWWWCHPNDGSEGRLDEEKLSKHQSEQDTLYALQLLSPQVFSFKDSPSCSPPQVTVLGCRIYTVCTFRTMPDLTCTGCHRWCGAEGEGARVPPHVSGSEQVTATALATCCTRASP